MGVIEKGSFSGLQCRVFPLYLETGITTTVKNLTVEREYLGTNWKR